MTDDFIKLYSTDIDNNVESFIKDMPKTFENCSNLVKHLHKMFNENNFGDLYIRLDELSIIKNYIESHLKYINYFIELRFHPLERESEKLKIISDYMGSINKLLEALQQADPYFLINGICESYKLINKLNSSDIHNDPDITSKLIFFSKKKVIKQMINLTETLKYLINFFNKTYLSTKNMPIIYDSIKTSTIETNMYM